MEEMTAYQIANVAELLLGGQILSIGLAMILAFNRPNPTNEHHWTGVVFVLWMVLNVTFPFFTVPGILFYRIVGAVLFFITSLFYARYCYGPWRKWILPLQLVITTNAVWALGSVLI